MSKKVLQDVAIRGSFSSSLQNSQGAGTVGTGVTAVEYGDGYHHSTVLTLTAVSLGSTADFAAKALGALIYTFPAGNLIIRASRVNVGVTFNQAAAIALDTIEFGLGTVIGAGVFATLGEVAAGAEDITSGPGTLLDDAEATEKVSTTAVTIATAGVHLVHYNIAATWPDMAAVSTTSAAGTVLLDWVFLG